MNEDIEVNIIKSLQSIPDNHHIILKTMSTISSLFHFNFYIFIILILYYYKKITMNQIFILCSSQIVIFGIKFLVKRKRPFSANSSIKLLEPMNFDEYSFPSGHTLNAYLLAYFIKQNTGFNLNFLPYVVGLSRIYMGVHYPTDVIGAIILGKIILSVKFSK